MPAEKFIPNKVKYGSFSTLTEERESKLRKLVAEKPSATLQELAHAMGNIVSHQTIKSWCVKLGIPHGHKTGRRLTLTPKLEKRLRVLVVKYPSGYKRIAVALGKPIQTVTDWIHRLGLPRRAIRATEWSKCLQDYRTQHTKTLPEA